MMEISLEYWNVLASQIILISSLMSGFSIAVVVSLLVYDSNNRFAIYTLKAAVIAAGSFLVTVFAMTKILMMTTKGYPINVVESDLSLPKLVGSISLLFGIISLSAFLSLLGWVKSKKTGIFTTIIGLLTFSMITLMLL